jgi:hypothetical protein
MIHTFILGYSGAQYFSEWHPQVKFGEDIKFYYIDNGKQNLDLYLNKILIHQSSKNIFCSGGWNLICDIAFNNFNLNKIIIGQEDAIFTDEILREIDNQTYSTQICGTYDRSFEFSLFGIHKDTFTNVGRFDENFILGGNEDNDYKQRCKLKNTKILSLNISADFNLSLTGNERSKYNNVNSSYLYEKWGPHSDEGDKIYKYEQPFDGKKYNLISNEYRKYFNMKEEDNTFMSELEYKIYKNK